MMLRCFIYQLKYPPIPRARRAREVNLGKIQNHVGGEMQRSQRKITISIVFFRLYLLNAF